MQPFSRLPALLVALTLRTEAVGAVPVAPHWVMIDFQQAKVAGNCPFAPEKLTANVGYPVARGKLLELAAAQVVVGAVVLPYFVHASVVNPSQTPESGVAVPVPPHRGR